MDTKNLKHLTLEELLVLYQEDKSYVFSEIYERLEKRLNAYICKRLQSTQMREEVLQIVFLKLHELRYRYNPKYLGLQWAYVIARSELKDYLKKDSKHLGQVPYIEELSQNELTSPNSEGSALGEKALMMVSEMKTDSSEILKLRVFDELAYNEIAEAMGLSEVNVRQKLSRLFKKMRQNLEGHKDGK